MVNFKDVKKDLIELFTTPHDTWPADYGHYGPFFVRLAWHCSGSYRTSDGRGGCEGGRQRFDPERSWEDNTNLDKARGLLWGIKEKYGLGLSWGDLFILAGTTAIEHMGGPILGFCAGRVDDHDGFWSEELGPTTEQEALFPCDSVNGNCSNVSGLGSTTVGLIYLNPEGPLGNPIPEMSAPQVRDSFGRMNMNDTETVALIGGGHAFGKTHGACPKGPGPSPKDDPENPWPGMCGTGKGRDAFTSGFEGPWTSNPTKWDNQYFQYLTKYDWSVHIGPGGKHQWRVNSTNDNPVAPAVDGNGTQDTMMMTSDISLLKDPSYRKIVEAWAHDTKPFDEAFKYAWYKLTTRDMGPRTRCAGDDVPPAQPWQFPLPPTPSHLADFGRVASTLRNLIKQDNTLGPLFVMTTWSCASTFRQTDFQGGCNGARLRFSPEKDWESNGFVDRALRALKSVKDEHNDDREGALSWSDLIVLAGQVGLEEAGLSNAGLEFCGGRTDASDGKGSSFVKPIVTGHFSETATLLREYGTRMGLSMRELVALMGRRSVGEMRVNETGFVGKWTSDPSTLSNEYFRNVLDLEWDVFTNSAGRKQYRANDGRSDLFMLRDDLLLKYDEDLIVHAQDFASDNDLFLKTFAAAWRKLVISDRYDGPVGNVCESR